MPNVVVQKLDKVMNIFSNFQHLKKTKSRNFLHVKLWKKHAIYLYTYQFFPYTTVKVYIYIYILQLLDINFLANFLKKN